MICLNLRIFGLSRKFVTMNLFYYGYRFCLFLRYFYCILELFRQCGIVLFVRYIISITFINVGLEYRKCLGIRIPSLLWCFCYIAKSWNLFLLFYYLLWPETRQPSSTKRNEYSISRLLLSCLGSLIYLPWKIYINWFSSLLSIPDQDSAPIVITGALFLFSPR